MTNIKKQLKRGFTLVELLVVIAIIAILAGLATPAVFSALKAGELTKTTHNMRQLSLSLLQYEQQFGHYPDAADEDAAIMDEDKVSDVANNLLLSLLIASGTLDSEENFFAEGGAPGGSNEPDGVIEGGEALSAGENGMTYIIKGAADDADEDAILAFSTSDNSAYALLVAPQPNPGEYNLDAYNKKAVLLRIDGSAKQASIGGASDDQLFTPGATDAFFDSGIYATDNAETPEFINPG